MSSPSPGKAQTCPHGRARILWQDFAKDLERTLESTHVPQASRRRLRKRLNAALTPQLMCILLHRLAHFLFASGWPRLATGLALLNAFLHKATIDPSSCIGGGLFLPHPVGVSFHGRSGKNLTLFSNALCLSRGPAFAPPLDEAPTLGDGVIIGGQAGVLGAVHIGSQTRIVYRTVAIRDAPEHRLVISPNVRSRTRQRQADKEDSRC